MSTEPIELDGPDDPERFLWEDGDIIVLDRKAFDPSLHPRDTHGRFTDGAGGASDIEGRAIATGTTPANFRETWQPKMSPADGHAWAEAAGTKYPQTVVHMTTAGSVEGIIGTGFHDSEQAIHEQGVYFATDPDTAEFYGYKGRNAVSAVVVLQNPLELDWTDPKHLSEAARSGDFRVAALDAAGVTHEQMISVLQSTGGTVYGIENADLRTALKDPESDQYTAGLDLTTGDVASMIRGSFAPSAERTTAALKLAGYDGVVIKPLHSADVDPTTGGAQVIVFDKEQAVVIGTENVGDQFVAVPGVGAPESEAWEMAIARAFAKDFNPNQPRDSHGRWSEVPGSGSWTIETMPAAGPTPRGRYHNRKLTDDLNDILYNHHDPTMSGPGADDGAAYLKIRNVKEIGAALFQRSKSDPALKSQLDVIGVRVIQTVDQYYDRTDETQAEAMQRMSERNATKLVSDYMADHLQYDPDTEIGQLDPVELGAREAAAKLQDTWMHSASDALPMSWGLQLAAAERAGVDTYVAEEVLKQHPSAGGNYAYTFGVGAPTPTGQWDRPTLEQAKAIAASPAVKAYVDEVYSRTQKYLADRGIDEITLYRGVHLPRKAGLRQGSDQEVILNPLSSFSTERRTAADFAQGDAGFTENQYVLTMTTAASRVFSLPTSGPGCLSETEMLVLGGPGTHVEVEAL